MRMDGIWANIFRLGQTDEGLKEILRRVPIFRDLGNRELGILTHIVHTRTYGPEEVTRKTWICTPSPSSWSFSSGEKYSASWDC